VIEDDLRRPARQHAQGFRADLAASELAELGFIVVQIDGMGTNWPQQGLPRRCWKNLKDAGSRIASRG
jgi:hypothetical protein